VSQLSLHANLAQEEVAAMLPHTELMKTATIVLAAGSGGAVADAAPPPAEQLDAAYEQMTEVRAIGRGLGYWGDMVIVLNDGSKMEMRSIDNWQEVKKYIDSKKGGFQYVTVAANINSTETFGYDVVDSGLVVKSTDTAGQGTELSATFEAGDITTYVSRYANKTRVDNLVPKNFGQVQEQETQFFTSSEGQRMFVGRSATTGNPQAGQQFYVVATNNLYSVDPGCSIVTYSLSVPAGQ
jgi:hypothetical protein